MAWRILRDWVKVQVAIVDAGQAAMAEIFLPYALDRDGETLYQKFVKGNIQLLQP